MGYTHYWKFKKNPKDIENGEKKFAKAAEMIAKGFKQLDDITICGGLGNGEPEISGRRIWFNGSAADETDYETFLVMLNDPEDYGFGFCKTARKPYDVAVCLALLCLSKAFGNDFEYSSDGNIAVGEEGWKRAKEIVHDCFTDK